MSALLSIQEAAELENLHQESLRQRIIKNTLTAIKTPTEGKGGHGFEYRIALENLSEKAQRKYYANLKKQAAAEAPLPPKPTALTELTENQREEAAFWKKVLNDWSVYISESTKNKTQRTKDFVAMLKLTYPDKKISERTLYRKFKELNNAGEATLADARRQNKGRPTKLATDTNEIAYSVFMQWWLDEARPTTANTYRLLKTWAEMRMPELLPLPSCSTFERAAKKLPVGVVKYFRYGNKAFEDECLPYIIRTYQDMESNEVWSADYHTLDFFVKDDITGEVFRPHMIGWFDVRSRKFLSIVLTGSANSDGTIIGFGKAVKKYGIPQSVYLDNGREFLVSDFGGRGIRKANTAVDYGQTILERMGVVMHNAKARNAKAKIIERAFRNICFDFSKLQETYCGGKPGDRPERLKDTLMDDSIPLLSTVRQELELYIEGWFNEQPSAAEGMSGATPNECYAKNLIKRRTATADQLELMLLRTEKPQTVTRNGVYLSIGTKKLWFYNEELVTQHQGKKVLIHYNPEDLSKVMVHDERDVKLMEAAIVEEIGYSFGDEVTKEAIKKLNRQKKNQKNAVTGFKDEILSIYQAPSPKDVMLEKAAQNASVSAPLPDIKIIEPVSFGFRAAPSMDIDENLVDLERMVQNAKRKREAIT